jgi:hypothetical protein
MIEFKKLSRKEMELIKGAAGTPPKGGGSSNSGNMTCGEEPDPVTAPQANEYWRSCMESGGKPTICPPGGLPTGS